MGARTLGAAGVIVALLVVGACGNSRLEGDDAMTPDEYERQIVRRLCTSDFATCCQAEGRTYGEENCRVFANRSAHHYLTGVRFISEAAERCLDAIARVPQTCEDYPEGMEACDEVWQPNRKVGELCTDHSECLPENGVPASCGGNYVCSTGSRILYRRGLEGDPCSTTCYEGQPACSARPEIVGESAACYESDGLYCSALNDVCQPIPHIGEPCESECVGTYCRSGTCAVPIPDGEPCVPEDVCETGLCVDGRCEILSYFLAACDYAEF